MLIYHRCRLILTKCRRVASVKDSIQSIYHCEAIKRIPVRHSSSDEYMKRKILLRINTALNDSENLNITSADSDTNNIACLNNEVIVSERSVKFPFHYRCLMEQQLAICPDRSVPIHEWQELYNVVGEPTKPLFASITMLVCVQLKHIERGRSLFQFVQQNYPNLLITTITTCTAYMNLLALDFFSLTGKKHCQDYAIHEKELCNIYDQFIKDKKQSVIASAAALNIIKGLCVTRRWLEAYAYLPFTNDDDQLAALTDLILAALHNDNMNTAIKLAKSLKTSPPNDSSAATTSSSLNNMLQDIFRNLDEKNEQTYDFIEQLFRYLSTLDYFIEKSVVDEMKLFFAKYQPNVFNYGTTTVFPNGACKNLSNLKLTTSELTDDEFHFLQNYLMQTAYTTKEVYNTTTPAEFENFKTVLARSKFTMIIDGLNILYGIDRFAVHPVTSMIKTINFLKNLRVPRGQMLFIARKHAFSRIPQAVEKDLRAISEIFLVDNTSRDDWFVLYAGVNCRAYVLTSDILRKERGIANKATPAKDAQVNETLQKWLYRYQYLFIRQANRVYFKSPLAYKLKAQNIQQVWLIPYFNEKPSTLAQRPENWFYVSKKASLAENKIFIAMDKK